MKLKISVTSILLLIVIACNFEASKMKRLQKGGGDEALPTVSGNNEFIDPREHTNPMARDLALKQTIWARNLIYYPNEILSTQMKLAGKGINNFLEFLTTKSDMEGQADVQESGEILGETLGMRILSGGILKGKPYSELKRVFEKFAENLDVTANDRMVLIAMLGDFGVLALETSSEGRDAVLSARYARILQKFASFCKSVQDVNCLSPGEKEIINPERTSAHVGPFKIQERKKKACESRTGIFNLGKQADEMIGVVVAKRIHETSSPVMAINKRRLGCEPWAGHMSGSPTEILYAWDIFTKEPPLISFQSHIIDSLPLDTPQRQAKAAAASAFLVAAGYHSAIECVEATYAYLGNDFRATGRIASGQNAAHSFDNGVATQMFVNIFKRFTINQKVTLLEKSQLVAVRKYKKK